MQKMIRRRRNSLHLERGYKILKIWWRGESIFSSRLFHARCFVLIFSKTEIIQSSENFLSKNTRQIATKSFKLSNPVILFVRYFTRRKILSFNSLVYFLLAFYDTRWKRGDQCSYTMKAQLTQPLPPKRDSNRWCSISFSFSNAIHAHWRKI